MNRTWTDQQDSSESSARPKVLIADDDDQVRELLKATIEPIADEVFVVKDGKQAVAALQTRWSDVLVLDLIMPEREGIETLLWVRKNCPHVAVIVVSGMAPIYGSTAKALGARAVFNKPFSRPALVEAIRGAWESSLRAATMSGAIRNEAIDSREELSA